MIVYTKILPILLGLILGYPFSIIIKNGFWYRLILALPFVILGILSFVDHKFSTPFEIYLSFMIGGLLALCFTKKNKVAKNNRRQ